MKHWLILACFVIGVFCQCDVGWEYNYDTDNCYKLISEENRKRTFDEHETNCVALGGHLASVKSKKELEFLTNLSTAYYSVNIDQLPFIGLYSTDSQCNGKWTDGTPFHPQAMKWQPDYLSNCRGRKCMQLVSDVPESMLQKWNNQRGGLNPSECNHRNERAICQKKGNADLNKKCKLGWTYYEKTDSCFKLFYEQRMSFDEAERNCIQHGGHLASVRNYEELVFIDKMCHRGMWQYYYDLPYIGMHSSDEKCTPSWIDGSKFDMNAVKYAPTEPNYCRIGRRCMTLIPDVTMEANGKEVVRWKRLTARINDFFCGGANIKRRSMRHVCKTTARVPLTCKDGWSQIEGTEICALDVVQSQKYKDIDVAYNLELKCKTLPHRTYFDATTLTCYVLTSNCYRVQTSVEPLSQPLTTELRATLAKKGLKESRETMICAFKPPQYCTGKEQQGRRCFWLTKKEQSWADAAKECEKGGGALFSPHSDRDIQDALQVLSSHEKSAAWLGLVSSKRWLNLDGSTVDYLRWQQNSAAVFTRPVATILVNENVSPVHGSYATYIRIEPIGEKFYGLCASGAHP